MSMGWNQRYSGDENREIILRRDELFNSMMGTYLTIKKISGLLYKNEPTREQKERLLQEAMNEMLGDCRSKSNKALFSVALCRERLMELSDAMTDDDTDSEMIKDLPF